MNKEKINKLLNWSLENYSHLPWRLNRSIYSTLVSEIMLQQTTVPTVIPKYTVFIEKFPSIRQLANASEHEVLDAWSGLGYYRRARNLHKAAKFILKNHNGTIPEDFHQLLEIDGIGDYTASALLSIGFNKRYLAIDANLERVISRLFHLRDEKGLPLKRRINNEFSLGKIFSYKNLSCRNLNEALMDFGREVCKSSPNCSVCFFKQDCMAYKEDTVDLLPVVKKKRKSFEELHLLRVMVKNEKNFYVYKKNQGLWLEGQYEVPTFSLNLTTHQYPYVIYKDYKKLVNFQTRITKYKITNYVLELNYDEFLKNFGNNFILKKYIEKKMILSTGTQKALKVIN